MIVNMKRKKERVCKYEKGMDFNQQRTRLKIPNLVRVGPACIK